MPPRRLVGTWRENQLPQRLVPVPAAPFGDPRRFADARENRGTGLHFVPQARGSLADTPTQPALHRCLKPACLTWTRRIHWARHAFSGSSTGNQNGELIPAALSLR